MTATTDASTVLETLVGRAMTNEEKIRIADSFVRAKTFGVRIPMIQAGTTFADPDNPTNEEKAQLFLDAMKWFGRQVVSKTAEKQTRADNDANVEAAMSAAELDFQ